MMSKNLLFWICQWSGWSIAILVNFIIQVLQKDTRIIDEIYSNGAFLLSGVVITWFLRKTYQRFKLLDLSPLKLIMPVMLFSILTTVCILFVSFSVIDLYNKIAGIEVDVFTQKMWLGNVIGIFPIILGWSLLYITINYLFRWRQSEIDKLNLESALKDAQLNTLIGQVNPHFMFNSLNNIRGLMLEDVNKSREMLTLLSKVLRYSLASHKKQLIPIKQELAMVRDFIKLSTIQFEERLQYQEYISVENTDIRLPPMIIQMLVENAIKHGISEVKGGGLLTLFVSQEGDKLHIKVTNPGNITGSLANKSTGIGLENIKQRLQLLFDDMALLTIEEKGGLVIVNMTLPVSH